MTRRTLERLNSEHSRPIISRYESTVEVRLCLWLGMCTLRPTFMLNISELSDLGFRFQWGLYTTIVLAYLLTYYTKEPKACRLVMPTMTSRDSMTSESWCRHDLQSRRIWKLGDYLCGIYNRTLSYNIVLKNQVIPLRTLGEDAIRRDRTSTEIQQISRHNQLPPQCFATYSAM